MTDPVPFLVKFPTPAGDCQFVVPGPDGLGILSMMLKGHMDWQEGVLIMAEMLPKALSPMRVDSFIESFMAAATCAQFALGG